MVKRELSRKVKLSIYQLIYVDVNRVRYKQLKWVPFLRVAGNTFKGVS